MKTCVVCGEAKTPSGFSAKRVEKCRECCASEKQKLEERASAERAFVKSICRAPESCQSLSGTRPCHGCSLSHKYKTDEDYRKEQDARIAKAFAAIESDTEYWIARSEQFKAMHGDPVFAAAHADRNRRKLAVLHADPQWQEQNRRRIIEHNTSDEVVSASVERLQSGEFNDRRIKGYREWLNQRRENEEFDAFMLRQEQEEAELELQELQDNTAAQAA